jgi:hypothetical protein
MDSINCPLSIKELKKPEISAEDYKKGIDQMTNYAFNDYVTLSSTRKVDKIQYQRMYEIAYENKIEDIMELYYM